LWLAKYSDISPLDEIGADLRFSTTTKEHAMWQNHCPLAGAFERFDDVEKKSKISIFLRRNPKPVKATIWVMLWIKAVAP
jgi:hypothetical protein